MEIPIKMDDLGENPLFSETPKSSLYLAFLFASQLFFLPQTWRAPGRAFLWVKNADTADGSGIR